MAIRGRAVTIGKKNTTTPPRPFAKVYVLLAAKHSPKDSEETNA